MLKTIKANLVIFPTKIKIVMLKNKIRSMNCASYLNLWDRIELRNTISLLDQLQHMQESNGSPQYSC